MSQSSTECYEKDNSENRSVDEHREHEAICEDFYVYPWMVIIANIPIVLKKGKYVGDSGKKLKDKWTVQGYKPTKVHHLQNSKGHTGFAIVEFNKDWTGFDNAMTFARSFEMDNHGKRDWQRARQKGEKLYAWIAREEEYNRKDKIGNYLRDKSDLQTISNIDSEAKKKMESLQRTLKEKEEDLEESKDLNQALLINERKINDELQDARMEFINGLKDRPTVNSTIGVKRMGDLDHKPIISAAKRKYPAAEEARVQSAILASKIEDKLRDSNWNPFKGIMVGAERKQIIDQEDEFLKAIMTEWGDQVYGAVVTALTEMNEYNPSGRYPVPELWNFKEGRKAALHECTQFILRRLKANKRRRRT